MSAEPCSSECMIKDGWFRELGDVDTNSNSHSNILDVDEGIGMDLKVKEVLYDGRSNFQHVLVFKSETYGNVLVLDGHVQCTERDEFMYQEMITHLPMNLHPCPEKVLVIGGGDGGVVREALKYDSVKEVVLCEIDEVVIEVSKKHLPHMSSGLSDPRVTVEVKDGIDYVRQHPGEYDVIITDAPDPEGVAEGLFQKAYYADLKSALRKGGIASFQGETIFIELPRIADMSHQCKEVFPSVGYAIGSTPTYISGTMGYMLASTNPDIDFTKPVRRLKSADLKRMKLRYYNSDIHTASFALPAFLREALQDTIDS